MTFWGMFCYIAKEDCGLFSLGKEKTVLENFSVENLAVVLFVITFFLLIIAIRWTIRQETQDEYSEAEKRRQILSEKKRQWNQKVDKAKENLVGANWRDPIGKTEFVRDLFGDEVPQYLWYELDDLTAEEVAEIYEIFWPSSGRSFGDFEAHSMLRIRRAEVFQAEIKLSTGKSLPLEQIGHAQFWELIDDDGFPDGTVLFSMKGFYKNTKTVTN